MLDADAGRGTPPVGRSAFLSRLLQRSPRVSPGTALLYRYRQSDSQALSVWLCTRNDALVNIAVIAAGAGVWASGTPWPDVAVAAVIACLALSSAVRIVRQALGELRSTRILAAAE
jgi:Co/Zn/Cd efflux system component